MMQVALTRNSHRTGSSVSGCVPLLARRRWLRASGGPVVVRRGRHLHHRAGAGHRVSLGPPGIDAAVAGHHVDVSLTQKATDRLSSRSRSLLTCASSASNSRIRAASPLVVPSRPPRSICA